MPELKLPPVLARSDFDSDEEYQEYVDAENSPAGPDISDERMRQALTEAAVAHLRNERERISLLVPKRNLSQLKARAMEEGMPYQTLINSILHKWLAQNSEAPVQQVQSSNQPAPPQAKEPEHQ